MIISHRHRFIFIKTRKTAGTSIEIALSRFCGEEDVITEINAEDEAIRRKLGHRGPRNFLVPFAAYRPRDWGRLLLKGRRARFHNHVAARVVRGYVGSEIWDSYYKFCFERNPWDKVVSWYFWINRTEPRPPLSEFLRTELPSDFGLYSIDGELAVDRVGRFERLQEDLDEIAAHLGLPGSPALPMAKSAFRKDRRDYREILGDPDRETIARVFAEEIARFGYEL